MGAEGLNAEVANKNELATLAALANMAALVFQANSK
jgi:hypothetical protein